MPVPPTRPLVRRRFARVPALVGALLIGLVPGLDPAPASAVGAATAGEPPSRPTVGAIVGYATVGDTVEVYGSGFTPNRTLNLYLGATGPVQTIGSTTDGYFEANLTVPRGLLPGSTPLVVSDATSGLSASTPLTIFSDWAQDGGDAGHTGHAEPLLIGPGNVATLTPKWSHVLADPGVPSPPLVIYDRVRTGLTIVVQQTTMSAFRTSDGSLVWRKIVPGPGSQAAFAPNRYSSDGFLVTPSGELRKFDGYNGYVSWSKDLGVGGTLSNPGITVAQGGGATRVVVSGNLPGSGAGGIVAAYAPEDGRLLWRFKTAAPVTGAAAQDSSPASGSTPAQAARVFVGTTAGKAFALDQASGALAWSTTTSGFDLGQPAVGAGSVVFGASAPFGVVGVGSGPASGPVGLYALSAATGKLQWAYDTKYGVGSATRPAIADGVVYAGFSEGGDYPQNAAVRALDLGTGKVRWSSADIPLTAGDGGWTDPVVGNGVVYTGSCGPNDKFLGFDAASGAKLLDANPRNCASPAVINERVYLSGPSGIAALGLPSELPPVSVVEDNTVGSGNGQLKYSGSWQRQQTAGAYAGDDHQSSVTGSLMVMKFTGVGVRYWFSTGPDRGIATVKVDGGPTTQIDEYSAEAGVAKNAWTSPTLSRGPHLLYVKVAGDHQAAATSSLIDIDRVDVGN